MMLQTRLRGTGFGVMIVTVPVTRGSISTSRPVISAAALMTAGKSAFTKFSVTALSSLAAAGGVVAVQSAAYGPPAAPTNRLVATARAIDRNRFDAQHGEVIKSHEAQSARKGIGFGRGLRHGRGQRRRGLRLGLR